jgi:hypothetical protein
MKSALCLLASLTILCWLGPAPGEDTLHVKSLEIEPARLALQHAQDRQRLVVTGRLACDSVGDLTRQVEFHSTNQAVAEVNDLGVVQPRAIGQAAIVIRLGPLSAQVPVVVESATRRPVSYANDIVPQLARLGCNSGACHGSSSGKKGFKVSLRGYDPEADYQVLTRGGNGRRLNFLDPEQSLLLLKPLGKAAHEGGKRMEPDSPRHRLLARWIAEGGKSDLETAPKLVSLTVWPAFRTFSKPGVEQQLLVRATYSDGSIRDVTEDARYSSSNENTARPDEYGLVHLPARGEAGVMVRYGPLIAVSNLVVMQPNPAFVWSNPPDVNYVDRLVNAKLRVMKVLPSDLSTDDAFLRRAYFDVIGLPPTPSEVRRFLADPRADKRARVIDDLLERPEQAEYWAQKWADLFKLRFELLGDKSTWGLYRYLRDSFSANKPFDRIVSELVTGHGRTGRNPAANFHRVFANPEEAAEATAQVFLGIRLLCAKCHDHPFEKWVQQDYYGFAAFFSQVSRKTGVDQDQVVFHIETPAQARHPRTGGILKPKYLDGASVSVDAQADATENLARWLTRKDNPFLARATVNRVWSQLFGRGIIDPVDDLRSSNPPVNGPLLHALARDFVAHDFDLRHLLRTVLNSRTYQLASRTNFSNADDRANFSHMVPRRLAAKQLLDAVVQITDSTESFRSRFGAGSVSLPVGRVRASQLPDRGMTSELLDLFGRPRGETSCTCERNDEASMTQALHLINGQAVARRLGDASGRVARLVQTAGATDAQVVEELYLLVMCRLPAPPERERMLAHFATSKTRQQSAEDLAWALLNSREFLFNH